MRPHLALTLTVVALALAGCTQPAPPAATDEPVEDAFEPIVFTGEVAKAPSEIVSTKVFRFNASQGVTAIGAVLTWSGPGALQLTYRSLEGGTLVRGVTEKAGRASAMTVDPPLAGEWEARVSTASESAIPFALTFTIDDGEPEETSFASGVLRVEERRLVEANVVLEAGATLQMSFNSTKPVAWDVHTHDPDSGQFTTVLRGHGGTDATSYTAPARGLYSVSFTADSGATQLEYELRGPFRMHSHTG